MSPTTSSAQARPAASEHASDARQLVSFSFYRLDPAWRRLARSTKNQHASELASVVEQYAKRLMVLTYSLMGLKADVDFLIWSVGQSLEDLQDLSGAIRQTAMGGYLSMPYAYFSMTKRST